MKKRLEKLIEKFLKNRRESPPGGGWAKITKDDLHALDEIIAELSYEKCGPDAGGDRPIEWRLLSRVTHRPSHYRAVPYDHLTEQDEEDGTNENEKLNEAVGIAIANLRLATEEIQQLLDIRKMRKEYPE